MTEQEQKDLDEMKAKIAKAKSNAIEYMIFASKNSLEHTGHKSIEALYKFTIDRLNKDIEKLTKEHVRKYPD